MDDISCCDILFYGVHAIRFSTILICNEKKTRVTYTCLELPSGLSLDFMNK
jgi:hypothetical protein